MTNLNLSAQDNIFDPNISRPVTLIGAGSVGSVVAVVIAKMGVPQITVYDHDYVESHNIPMSAYGLNDLGISKVQALKRIIKNQTGAEIKAIEKKYTNQRLSGTIIACVDDMEERKSIYNSIRNNVLVDLFIDTRVSAEYVSIFAIEPCKPEDVDFYEYYLRYATSEANLVNCGCHGAIFISMKIAGTVGGNLTNFWQNGKKERHYRELCVSLQRV